MIVSALTALLSLQYPLYNDGTIGAPRADVDARSAWEITTGTRDVIVAILDTGVDITHPDLAASIWTNPGEIPGNLVDDDLDGLVDDVNGWDFADGDADVSDAGVVHGTLIAGLVSGTETGLAPGVTLLPVKLFSSSGLDPDFENVAAAGLEYAIAHGAKVIQISWELDAAPGPALRAAFNDVENAGALVVVAAGNDGVNLTTDPRFPVALDNQNIVGVAGTDRYDRPVNLPGLFVTNFGVTWVEIAAPTEQDRTTIPGGGLAIFTGTSASAPLVSAAAALVWSVNPSLTAAQVRNLLLEGGDRLPQLEGLCTGASRLNAGNTVRLAAGAEGEPPHAVVGRVRDADPGTPILFDGRLSFGSLVYGTAAIASRWNFADGTIVDAPITEHVFRTGGDWPVTLEVTDLQGVSHVARTLVRVPFRATPESVSIASAHPYPGGTQLVVPVTIPGAAWIRLHFTQLETASTDALVIFDGAWTGNVSYQGNFGGFTTAPIRGDTAYLYLRGFTGGTFGFAIDRVDAEFDGEADTAPVARTNAPISVVPGVATTLSAADSYDADGDALTFEWRLVSAPDGSSAALSATTGADVTFTPDRRGSYAFALTASDGEATGSTLAWIVTREADDPGCQCATTSTASPRVAPLVLGAVALVLLRRGRHARGPRT